MAYPIDKKLVVGISANALFELKTEDDIFTKEGLEAYRTYQTEHRRDPLPTGVAFPFIKRLLHINDVYKEEKLIEVVLLSKNSPETGIRIFNSINHHQLDISRAAFMSGSPAYEYIPAFNISLFLSTNETDVKLAIDSGYPAGRVIRTNVVDDPNDFELCVAFDFDGVVVDDEAEKIYQRDGLEKYYEYEKHHKQDTLQPGPLARFFGQLAYFQKLEAKKATKDPKYKKLLKTVIMTARNAPAHERAVNTLNSWGVTVDQMLLLGGVDKSRFLEILKPHLYFDDQLVNLNDQLKNIPLVHIPFGIRNEPQLL